MNTKTLNTAVLKQLILDVGVDVVKSTVVAIFDDAGQRAKVLEYALINGDLNKIANEAHAMKSTFATVGLCTLQEQLVELEMAALRNLSINADDELRRFTMNVLDGRSMIEAFLKDYKH